MSKHTGKQTMAEAEAEANATGSRVCAAGVRARSVDSVELPVGSGATTTTAVAGTIEFAEQITKSLALMVIKLQAPAVGHGDVLLVSRDGWSRDTLTALMAVARVGVHVAADGDVETLKDDPAHSCLHPTTVTLSSGPGGPEQAGHTFASAARGLGQDGGSPGARPDRAGTAAVAPAERAETAELGDASAGAATVRSGGRKERGSGASRKNSNKSALFAKFLVDTFGRDRLRQGTGVLDVAGGNGDLSTCLTTIYRIPTTVVDPDLRPNSKRTAWILKLRAEWIATLQRAPTRTPLVAHLLRTWQPPAPRHIGGHFVGSEETRGAQGPGSYIRSDTAAVTDAAVAELLQGCSIIVGLHADQPTGAIVSAAVALGKPFAVIPCCVFRKQYPARRTCGGYGTGAQRCRCKDVGGALADGHDGRGATAAHSGTGEATTHVPVQPRRCRQVVTHEELCEHLAARGNGQRTELGFGGRQVCVWADTSQSTLVPGPRCVAVDS